MSNKKNLLNEAQVRQFMKLASLQPLTPGFVHGLTERGEKAGDEGSVAAGKKGDTDYSGKGERKGDESETHEGEDLEEGHGRGANEYHEAGVHRGGGIKLDEEGMQYRDDVEAELGATEDELGAEDELADVEGEELEDVEGDVDVEADAGGEPTLTVAQVVDAIENALQELLPDEEVEAEYVAGEEEVEGEEPGGEVEDVDVDLEAGDVEELEEGEKEWAAMAADPKPKGEKEEKAAAEFVAAKKRRAKDPPSRGSAASRIGAGGRGGGGGMKIGGITAEGNTDELVEQITKRVAARILKAALRKK